MGIRDSVKDERYIAMLNFIQANYKTVSLADMAAQFNLTEPYISKYIKEKSGKTFGEPVSYTHLDVYKRQYLRIRQ